MLCSSYLRNTLTNINSCSLGERRRQIPKRRLQKKINKVNWLAVGSGFPSLMSFFFPFLGPASDENMSEDSDEEDQEREYREHLFKFEAFEKVVIYPLTTKKIRWLTKFTEVLEL